MNKYIIFLVTLLLLFPTSWSQEIEIAISEETLDFSAIKSKYIDVNFVLEIPILIEEYKDGDYFILKTPIFSDNQKTQRTNVEAYYLEGDKKIFANIIEDDYGNLIAEFSVKPITRFEYTFYISGNIVSENKIVFSNNIFNLNNKITEFEEYTKETKYIKSDSLETITLANSLKYFDNSLEQLTFMTNWVHQYLTYDLEYAETIEDSLVVLSTRKGVCDEFSILLAALLRAQGFPVKYVTGIANTSFNWENHAWLEVYIPEQGWIPVDPTYNEVGLVDSSHIIIAKVNDPSQSQDLITASNSVVISFLNKKPSYKINEQKSFADLGYANVITITPIHQDKLKSGSGINLKLSLKNTTVKPISILLNLEHHADFELLYPKSSKQLIYFNEFESKEINYYFIAPKIPANVHGYIYPFRISSQISDVETQITVSNDSSFYQDIFFVTDPLFYFVNNNIVIETDLINETNTKKKIDFNFDYNGNILTKTVEIDPKERKTFQQEISLLDRNESNFKISISGDFEYSRLIKIYADKIVPEEIIDANVSTVVSTKQIDDQNKELWENSEEFKITQPTKLNKTVLFVFMLFLVLGIVGYLVTNIKKIKH